MRNRTSLVIALLVSVIGGPALAGDISPQANREYLAKNAMKPGVEIRPSGLQIRVIKSGMGPTPGPDDIVTVSYKGSLVDGTVFDQTKPGETHDLPASKVVPGWIEAMSLMKEGDEWEIVLPAELGYGDRRVGNGSIPPGQVLTFTLQLVAVKHPK
jgi:FKBP-type peptidyl-prolyl cis-trans isomerase